MRKLGLVLTFVLVAAATVATLSSAGLLDQRHGTTARSCEKVFCTTNLQCRSACPGLSAVCAGSRCIPQ